MDDVNQLFIRINYKTEGASPDGRKGKINQVQYIAHQNASKYLIGGGFINKNRGSIILKAKNLEEAKELANHNKLIKNDLYNYDLLTYDIMTFSTRVQE